MVTNMSIFWCYEFTYYEMYESINKFIMMNMEYYKVWIELYNTKRNATVEECALFCSQNLRGTFIK